MVLLVLSRLGGIYAFNVVYFLLMPYIVIFLALYPSGPIRLYNRLGDYSYGVYIVAFPIQQMLVASIPSLSPLAMIIFSFAITLPLAVLSWTYVEKPALRLKGH